jgi:HEAT repeat protein
MFRKWQLRRRVADLSSPDPKRREAAIRQLGEIGAKEAIGSLRHALGDEEGAVRLATAKALAQLGQAKWQTWVEGNDGDCRRLASSGDPDAISGPLVAVLQSTSRDVPDGLVAEPLIAALRDKRSGPELKAAVTAALAASGNVEGLLEAIHEPNYHVFKIAAGALAERKETRAVKPLLAGLSTNHLCGIAAEALGKMGAKEAVPTLVKMLGRSEDVYRKVAAESLAKLGQPRWQQFVRGESPADFLHLCHAGTPDAVSPLIVALSHVRGEVRSAVVEALGRLRDPAAVESLIKVLLPRNKYSWKDRGVGAAAVAARALGRLGGQDAVEALIQAVGRTGRGERTVRKAAAKALVRLAPLNPALIRAWWKEMRPRLATAHGDSHRDHEPPSDCHGDKHTDVGTGVDLPEQLPAASGAAGITVRCPNPACARRLRVAAEHAGKRGRCPDCGQVIDIPAGWGGSGDAVPPLEF